MDPSITQNYLIQNFLYKNFNIIIYDDLKRVFVDTEKISMISEVVEVDIKNIDRKWDFYNNYKFYYLALYQDIKSLYILQKYKKIQKNFDGNLSMVVETKENQSILSNIFLDDENNLIQKLTSPIKKNDKIYGVALITSTLNKLDKNDGINSFNLINLYFVMIIIMFFSSLFFSRSIVYPIKLLSKITKIERDKSSSIKKTIHYPSRQDEIGQLSDDIKSMSNDLKRRIEEMEQFSADVSHELKNPISALRSSRDLLSMDNLNDKDKKILMNNMNNDIIRMNVLINDISNYTLTQVEISKEITSAINLNSFLNEFNNSYFNKNFAIEVMSEHKNIVIVINQNKFLQVLHNLIDNAYSFSTNKKKFLINIKKDSQSCLIHFVDDGLGINMDYKEKIFERFYTDRVEDRENHTGLGLSISRNIIESFNGSLKLIKNRYSGFEGACFEIKLPLKDL